MPRGGGKMILPVALNAELLGEGVAMVGSAQELCIGQPALPAGQRLKSPLSHILDDRFIVVIALPR